MRLKIEELADQLSRGTGRTESSLTKEFAARIASASSHRVAIDGDNQAPADGALEYFRGGVNCFGKTDFVRQKIELARIKIAREAVPGLDAVGHRTVDAVDACERYAPQNERRDGGGEIEALR